MTRILRKGAFSLVECVFAIGITAFVITALLGLISLNLKSNSNSAAEMDAANLCTMLMNARRILPADRHALALPPLTNLTPGQEVTKTVNIDNEGNETTEEQRFRLTYRLKQEEKLPNLYRLYLKLKWPATPAENKTKKNEFEINTTIRLDQVPVPLL